MATEEQLRTADEEIEREAVAVLQDEYGAVSQAPMDHPTVVLTPEAKGPRLLGREEILNADDTVFEIVDVPEWGGQVRVKSLSGAERDSFEASLVVREGKRQTTTFENIRAKLVARSVVDMEGRPVLSDADVQALGRKSAAALDRVYEVAARLSRITDADVEELAGNSASARSGGS